MADSVCTMIQLEEDYCSKHSTMLLSILDLQVKVQKMEEVSKPFLLLPLANGQLASHACQISDAILNQANLAHTIWSLYSKEHKVRSTLV